MLYHGGRLYHGVDGGDYHGSKRDSLCDMTAGETPSRRHGRLYFYHGSKGDSLAVAEGTHQHQCLLPRWTRRLSCHSDTVCPRGMIDIESLVPPW